MIPMVVQSRSLRNAQNRDLRRIQSVIQNRTPSMILNVFVKVPLTQCLILLMLTLPTFQKGSGSPSLLVLLALLALLASLLLLALPALPSLTSLVVQSLDQDPIDANYFCCCSVGCQHSGQDGCVCHWVEIRLKGDDSVQVAAEVAALTGLMGYTLYSAIVVH